MERSRINPAGNTATHSLATTAIEPQSASLDSLHHYTAHRPILSFRPMWHQNEGCREANHPSYNLAKIPFELGIRVQRERLKPSYGDGFHGAPLVVWPTFGDRLPEKGGADAPARQGPKAVIDSGEP